MDAPLTLRRVGIRRRSDEDVLALAFGGDPVAFAEVYRRYDRPLYGYCLARLMDPEAAADAVQEVFVRFLNTPREGVEKPRAWLYGVARNVTVDAIRARVRAPVTVDDESIEDAAESTIDAADEFFGREDARDVFLALRRMRPRYRTALILRDMHHESAADMADALVMTPGAVDTLVSRARDAFGRTYGEVAGLPSDCRDATAAIYKRTGTGLDAQEEQRLQSHLIICTRCRAEAKMAHRLDRLSALLPFFIPTGTSGHTIFERAGLWLRRAPDLAAQIGYALAPDRAVPAAKLVAGLLAVTIVAGAGAASVESHRRNETSGSTRVSTERSDGASSQREWLTSHNWGGGWVGDPLHSGTGWGQDAWSSDSSRVAGDGTSYGGAINPTGSRPSDMNGGGYNASGSGSTSTGSTSLTGGGWTSHTGDTWNGSRSGPSDSISRHW